MRIALMADIHSNLPALEAVLKDIKRHTPDRILSLGDQVNLGPCPRETLQLLRAEGVICLHGNHERYILSAMDGDPNYTGANFESLRWNASLLTREEITLPRVLELEGALFTHALPDDDRFPMFDVDKALPMLRAMTFDRPTHIFCGHGHNPTHIQCGNVTMDSIGSTGCMDDCIPGAASYSILTIEHGQTFLRPYYVSYDVSSLPGLFLSGGMADACPIMAHIVYLQMTTNQNYIMDFVGRALSLSRERGEAVVSLRTWQDTDAAFPWPDGMTSSAFWKQAARS